MGEKLIQYIAGAFKWCSGILVGLTVILNFVSVIMRYALNNPIMWCEEISLFMFVSAIYFVIVPMTYNKRAVKLDFFIDLVSPKIQQWVLVVVETLSGFALATVSVLGVSLIKRTKYRFTPILQISYKYIYLVMVIGMGISAIIFLNHAIGSIKKLQDKSTESIK